MRLAAGRAESRRTARKSITGLRPAARENGRSAAGLALGRAGDVAGSGARLGHVPGVGDELGEARAHLLHHEALDLVDRAERHGRLEDLARPAARRIAARASPAGCPTG